MRIAPRSTRRVLAAIALGLVASLTAVAGGSAAAEAELSGTDGIGAVTRAPLSLGTGPTTVVLKLAGNPVAVVQAARGAKLAKGEKEAIKAELKAVQSGLRSEIAKLGGQVLAEYQVAYNGIKVRIDRKNVDALAQLPNVVAVRPLQVMERDNVRGVPMIGAPGVWDGVPGLHGEGIKIAVIDTGIDYTHANFGGPGTTAAYNAANATDTLPASAVLFGPAAPRVKGGIDLVGDDYDASADDGDPALIPQPDPNPLDCNGHGSHVAGSAAGSGVLANGSTYNGAYDANTIANNSWTIGPGVAPKADIYGVRVFGCAGSTDVTVDAIEWAVDEEMDVINMSLGSAFGSKTDPSAEASTNAANAGVIVVTSAGNSGPNQYITGSPGVADGAIATAALDPVPTFPGVGVVAGDLTMDAINANGHEFNGPLNGTLKVIQDNPATAENEALGCSVAAYGGPLPAGTIAVVNRDTCARVAKAIFGQQAGAAAVIMVNNAAGLPPFEGKITSNPDDGTPFTVTIPFLGVRGPATTATSDGAKLRAKPDGTAVTLTPKDLVNPGFKQFASFSSGGPRMNDSALKPDITAPGVSTVSTGNGTGNGAATISGTSMASPHVAGVAALTRQAYPTWSVRDIKAAIVNTGEPGGFAAGYRTSRGGTGLVQPQRSTKTSVVAGVGSGYEVAANFGFAELSANFVGTKTIEVRNNGTSAATFNLAAVAGAAATTSPHTLGFSSSTLVVPAGGSATFDVTLTVPAATAGSSSGGLAFREAVGLIELTPAAATDNGGIKLRVPYYMVPRSLSNVDTTLASTSKKGLPEDAPVQTSATVTNIGGARAGGADFYAWGLADADDATTSPADLRAVGVQSFPASDFVGAAALPGERALVFAVNTHHRWSTAAVTEFDIPIDVDRDKKADYIVVGADQGAVQTGTFNGRMGAFVFSTRSAGAAITFLASDPTNSSTVLLPILGRSLCRAGEPCLAPNKLFTYEAVGFDLDAGGSDAATGSAEYDAFNPVVGEGSFASVNPGATANVPFSIDVSRFNKVKPLGLMVVTLDNAAGAPEADLLPISLNK